MQINGDTGLKHVLEDANISEEEKILLGVIRSLELRPKDPETGETIISETMKVKPTRDGIMAISSRRLGDQKHKCPIFLESLVQKKLLYRDGEMYALTDTGQTAGKEILAKWTSEWFDDILIRSAGSEAHALFCERVFGKNLYQFNGMDMQRLELMLEALNLQPDDYVLDLGCGLGKIAEYISVRTGARVLGMDFAEKVIDWARKNTRSSEGRLAFQMGNMNDLNLSPSTFDAIIAIDTLYPWNVEDLVAAVRTLKRSLKPRGRMGIFAAAIRELNEPLDLVQLENTKMARALRANGLLVNTVD
ncbi:MAG: class I SAM-dependent methyltransferase, partial [Candidatus Odinarchaeota archaeon]